MTSKLFLSKLKIPAFREGLCICCITIVLLILGPILHWSKYYTQTLDKYREYALDESAMTFTICSLLLIIYLLRRRQEKQKVIEQLGKVESGFEKTRMQLEVLLKSSSSIIFNTEASRDFKLLYITENVSSILGYKKEEYYEKSWWFNNIHPEDQPKVAVELSNLFTSGSLSCEFRFKHKNNYWVWMHATSQLIYSLDGTPTETVGTWWDISLQKEAETAELQKNERVQLAFEATRDVIYDWDLVTNDMWMSEEIYRSYGYNKNTVINIDWWESKIHPDDHDTIFTDVMDAIAQKKTSWHGEYRYLCEDGSYKNVFDKGFVIYSAEGAPSRWIGSMSDITTAKQVEIELRKAKEKAEESVKFKSEFLANMSHEIRTPLNGIIGMTELIQETDINPQQKRFLENIHISSENLLSLINDILDFSKIDTGKLELSPVNFSLRDQIPKVLQGLSLKSSIKKLEFLYCIDPKVPDLFYGDLLRLQQVIINLAGNAIKFTEKGEVEVKCSLQSINKTKANLLFSVTDTGIGIEGDKLETIFNEFTQADGSISRRYGGTGLGLAISKSIVEMMEGKIWVESEEGKGTTFFFTINMDLQEVQNIPRFIPDDHLDGQKVLIVEANKKTRDYTLQVITQFKMKGFATTSGEAALIELNKAVSLNNPYALVLLDINLTGQMDGFDVAEEIQKNKTLKNTGIIVISMSQKAKDRERFAQMGVKEFFSKPFSQSDLLDTIQNMLLSGYPNLRLHPNTSNNQKIALPLQKGPALKILIAEDNIINQEVAFNMLSKLGHSVTVVNNGEEAVEAVLGENYDIIFMDVQMPKMNGYEATGRICEIEKNTNHKTHIIGLTANAMQGDREKCVEKGMDDYVSKPFRAPHIINAIERFTTKVKMGIGQQRNNRDEKPLVNLQALFENLNRDEEMFEEFVGKLPKHITTSFEKLERAVKLENLADIEFAAHSLRGLCLYLDMYKVSALTIEIEKSATSSNLHTMVTLVNRMKKELHRALEYLQQVREESLAEILL